MQKIAEKNTLLKALYEYFWLLSKIYENKEGVLYATCESREAGNDMLYMVENSSKECIVTHNDTALVYFEPGFSPTSKISVCEETLCPTTAPFLSSISLKVSLDRGNVQVITIFF